ncbi:MAG: hypothetical protein IJD77_05320 [Clostridia bacterium]|nr:hypothetical protein [Clostridia bacterium]
MDKFILLLGKENNYLPGKIWTEYEVDILKDRMFCVCKEDNSVIVSIQYSEFKKAEFGIGNGNLWLQCELENGPFVFCAPRKYWKSETGKKLIELINNVVPIKDMKAYKQYTGPFFFIHMFR